MEIDGLPGFTILNMVDISMAMLSNQMVSVYYDNIYIQYKGFCYDLCMYILIQNV